MGCGMAGSLGNGGDGGSSLGTGATADPSGRRRRRWPVRRRRRRRGWRQRYRRRSTPVRRAGWWWRRLIIGACRAGHDQSRELYTAPTVEITPVPRPTCENLTTSTSYRQAGSRAAPNAPTSAEQALTYSIVTGPAHGEIRAATWQAGQVTYTPAAGFSGTDKFTYDASSTNGTSTAVTVSIVVAPQSVAHAGRAHRSKTGAKIPVPCSVDGVGTGPDRDVNVTLSTNGVTVGDGP